MRLRLKWHGHGVRRAFGRGFRSPGGDASPLCADRDDGCASAAAPLADQSPTWASASRGARGWELKQLADRLAEMPCLVAKNVAEGWILVIPQWPAMAGVRK